MGVVYFKRIVALCILVLFQVLILNHIHFFGYATPFLYIYFLLKFNAGTSHNELLLWGFATGLSVDTFSNTPGVATAATTFYALIQPWLIRIFTPRDSAEDLVPGFRTMGVGSFWRYVIFSVLIHHTLLITIETFTFIYWVDWLITVLSSSLFTILCIIAIEGVSRRKKDVQ